jgi:5'-deoxynucleotidase YfbR-like HD superfamily hydrolase
MTQRHGHNGGQTIPRRPAPDLPHLIKQYVTTAAHEAVTADQVRPLPEPIAAMIRGAVTEYESGETPEARCARDADKRESVLQVVWERAVMEGGFRPGCR